MGPEAPPETPASKKFVAVAGNIGVGKSTLVHMLASRLGWQPFYEPVGENPYLADFYADMKTWAFHLQVFFLGHRAEQHLAMARLPGSAIVDRSIYEDAEIFARASLELGNVNERDYLTYRRLYELVVGALPAPDLLLYLRTPVAVLLERIRARGRAIEQGITAEYLTLLERHYDEWLARFDVCPVLTLPSDDLDFVHKDRHLDIVVQRIEDRLAGKEEVRFPAE